MLLEPMSKDEEEDLEKEWKAKNQLCQDVKVRSDSKQDFTVRLPLNCSIEIFKRLVLTKHREPFVLAKHDKKNDASVQELLDNDGAI